MSKDTLTETPPTPLREWLIKYAPAWRDQGIVKTMVVAAANKGEAWKVAYDHLTRQGVDILYDASTADHLGMGTESRAALAGIAFNISGQYSIFSVTRYYVKTNGHVVST